jgi:ABC-type transport system substrate-binding protein
MRMKTRKLTAIVLAMALALALFTGCTSGGGPADSKAPDVATPKATEPAKTDEPSKAGEPSKEPENKTLVVGSAADPKYWDPWGQFNFGRRDVIPMVYQTLIAPVPDLGKGGTET